MYRPALTNAARETLRRFSAAGKKLILIDDVPRLTFDPRACIPRGAVASSTARTPCAITIKEFNDGQDKHPEIVAQLMKEFPMVELFETAPHLCDATHCHAMLNGVLMYRDNNHLTHNGDLYIGSKFSARPKVK